mgnify:CR=1 FL=1
MISASFSVLLKVLNTVPGSNWNLSHKPESTTVRPIHVRRLGLQLQYAWHMPEALFQAM